MISKAAAPDRTDTSGTDAPGIEPPSIEPPSIEPPASNEPRIGKPIDPPRKPRGVSARTLWITCGLAVGMLAALVTANHFVADALIARQTEYGQVINVAGRQRVMTQRVARYATLTATAQDTALRDAARLELLNAADLMRLGHDVLIGADGQDVADTLTDDVRAHLFEGLMPLDTRVRAFVARAETVAREASDDPGADRLALALVISEADGAMMGDLDKLVRLYEANLLDRVGELRLVLQILWLTALGVLALELLVLFRPLINRVVKAQRELSRIARTDPMTGICNRRAVIEDGGQMFLMSRRHGRPLSVVLGDIDKFKRINDTYGHHVGDAAIVAFCDNARSTIRESDVLGRIGGEEFVLTLPETDLRGAEKMAQRLREAIEKTPIVHPDATFRMTASFGVAEISDNDHTLEDMLTRADAALYRAKEGGRNRVELAGAGEYSVLSKAG